MYAMFVTTQKFLLSMLTSQTEALRRSSTANAARCLDWSRAPGSKTGAILGLLLGCLLAFSAAADQGPRETVSEAVDTILGILADKDQPKEVTIERLRAQIERFFDSRAIVQGVLGNHWQEATPAQREEFEALFIQLLENTYMGRIDAYNNETVDVLGETINDNRASVDTVIRAQGINIRVAYRLRQRNNGWFVFDVVVEGISLVGSFRETYRGILARSGMDGLLTQMRERIRELEQQKQLTS